MTDVGSDTDSIPSENNAVNLPLPFQDISLIREHQEFLQMVINAKTTADINDSPATVHWRGSYTTIPKDFRLTKESLSTKLISSLKDLKDISEVERKVKKTLFTYYIDI